MKEEQLGEGCELMIIDDPVKNREEANSKTIQTRIWEEYQEILYDKTSSELCNSANNDGMDQ